MADDEEHKGAPVENVRFATPVTRSGGVDPSRGASHLFIRGQPLKPLDAFLYQPEPTAASAPAAGQADDEGGAPARRGRKRGGARGAEASAAPARRVAPRPRLRPYEQTRTQRQHQIYHSRLRTLVGMVDTMTQSEGSWVAPEDATDAWVWESGAVLGQFADLFSGSVAVPLLMLSGTLPLTAILSNEDDNERFALLCYAVADMVAINKLLYTKHDTASLRAAEQHDKRLKDTIARIKEAAPL